MPEGYGLNSLTDEARAILIRLMSGVHIRDIQLMDSPEISTPEICPGIFQHQPDIAIASEPSQPDWSISSRLNKQSPVIIVDEKSVEPYIEGAIAQVKTFKCDEITVLECESIPDEHLSCKIEDLKISIGIPRRRDTKIESARMRVYPCINKPKGVKCMDFTKEIKFHRDIGRIYRIPMNIKHCSWRWLDKPLIIRCWSLLQERAHAKWGEFPEKYLEMAAVYPNVDLTYVRKIQYHNTDRSLLVWLRPKTSAGTLKTQRCVIIIGLIKGTGKVIQVVMPVDEILSPFGS
jgi:hypothetical protein